MYFSIFFNGTDIFPFIIAGLCALLIIWWLTDATIRANRDLRQMRESSRAVEAAEVAVPDVGDEGE